MIPGLPGLLQLGSRNVVRGTGSATLSLLVDNQRAFDASFSSAFLRTATGAHATLIARPTGVSVLTLTAIGQTDGFARGKGTASLSLSAVASPRVLLRGSGAGVLTMSAYGQAIIIPNPDPNYTGSGLSQLSLTAVGTYQYIARGSGSAALMLDAFGRSSRTFSSAFSNAFS